MALTKKRDRNELIHELFIIDAELKEKLDFNRRKEITRNLIDDLMKALNMEELGPLQVYDAVDPEYPGWSFIQPITTSHISGHYFEEDCQFSHIHLDIYSCKDFQHENVLFCLQNHLPIRKWIGNLIYRSQDLRKRKELILRG